MPRRSKRVEPAGELPPSAPTPDEYAAFVGQIELRSIWLAEAHVVNPLGPRRPKETQFAFEVTTQLDEWLGGFIAWHEYHVRLQADAEKQSDIDENVPFTIDARFGLEFDSQTHPSDAIFDIFGRVNLPLNTWPYLRSFVADTLGRMGWEAITLPAFKVGVALPQVHEAPASTESTASNRPRRTRTSAHSTTP